MSFSLYGQLSRKFGPRVDGPTRRGFLAATLAGTAGVMLSTSSGFGQTPKPNGKRIVVIGAGFSGLAAAFELLGAGYDVTVVEARNRVGGRVLSFGDFVPKKNVEGGGELIGSNHPTWVAYAERFGLEFLEFDKEPEDARFPIFLNGQLLSTDDANALWERMEAALQKMNADAEAIDADQPWKSPDAEALDKRKTSDWIDSLGLDPVTKAALSSDLAANNGQTCDKQSYLGNLTQIKGGGVEKYWSESEVYRCNGGNQQLAFKLAEAIGSKRIILGLPVRSVNSRGKTVMIDCADGRTIECDEVIVAIPPTTWKKIDFNPAISPLLMPQMGVNTKYLSHVKAPFWVEKKLLPGSITDGPVSMTWDATDNQYPAGAIGEACLTVFSGGPAAEKTRSFTKDQLAKVYADQLEILYPGYKENLIGTPRYMDWPSEPWTLAGYSFPAPGQITTVGPALRRGMPLVHFAGEHTCYKFVGYMEGALNSGASLAKRLAQRDGVWKPPVVKPTTAPASTTAPAMTPSMTPATEPAMP